MIEKGNQVPGIKKLLKGISPSKVVGNNANTQEKLSNTLIKFHTLKNCF